MNLRGNGRYITITQHIPTRPAIGPALDIIIAGFPRVLVCP
jgi:hypothetical protein